MLHSKILDLYIPKSLNTVDEGYLVILIKRSAGLVCCCQCIELVRYKANKFYLLNLILLLLVLVLNPDNVVKDFYETTTFKVIY